MRGCVFIRGLVRGVLAHAGATWTAYDHNICRVKGNSTKAADPSVSELHDERRLQHLHVTRLPPATAGEQPAGLPSLGDAVPDRTPLVFDVPTVGPVVVPSRWFRGWRLVTVAGAALLGLVWAGATVAGVD